MNHHYHWHLTQISHPRNFVTRFLVICYIYENPCLPTIKLHYLWKPNAIFLASLQKKCTKRLENKFDWQIEPCFSFTDHWEDAGELMASLWLASFSWSLQKPVVHLPVMTKRHHFFGEWWKTGFLKAAIAEHQLFSPYRTITKLHQWIFAECFSFTGHW